MIDNSKPLKWHTIDEAALKALTIATDTTALICPIGTNALPEQLKRISGVFSSFRSSYVTPQVLSNGLAVGGEMLVMRTEGATTKNYLFPVATNASGIVQFAGPFTGPGHHVTSGQHIQVSSLFGHTPFSTKVGS